MRVPLRWLRSYCDPDLSTAELAERLAMTGIDVERVDRVGVGDPAAFVVGKVRAAEPHPDADRLTVCEVDDGDGSPRTIVCGAPNVASGQTVAVARPGAVMPDGTRLGEPKLRGVRSQGMILAEDEVGVGEDHGGIMVLSERLEPGTPLIEALQIADEVLELEVNTNRPDCLGVYGVAREVHAVTGAPLAPDPGDEDAEPSAGGKVDELLRVEIDPEICLRFTARVFEDVALGPSPLWLKQRLTAAGQRPISNVVDITNYVMLLTGQPLHAFDLDRVRGGRLVVRRASDGERLETLDGVVRTLDPSMTLIADGEGPSSLAGVMGGAVSEVSDSTTRVCMEVATWVGPNILRTSSRLGLRSEASARFEKQLHPEQSIAAQRVASRLVVELCGGRLVPGTVDVYPNPAEPRVVTLRAARIEELLGAPVPGEEVEAILGRLGFAVSASEPGVWRVTVPAHRDADVQREADLVEEVARVHGLWKLPVTLPSRERAVGRLTGAQRLRRRLEDVLRDRGMDEVVAYSYTAPETIARLRLGDLPLLRIANPLSEEASVMRPLLLPGLLDAARHNAARGNQAVSLFESAHVYRPAGPLEGGTGDASPRGARPAEERHHLAGLITRREEESWRRPAARADFYAVKGYVEAVLGSAGVGWRAEPTEQPFLHPGRSAAILARDDRALGFLGELHPLVARDFDLEAAACFELDADLLLELAAGPGVYRELDPFPAVLQDIAVVVDEDVPAEAVIEAVHAGAGELLRAVRPFDLYRGEQLGEGRKSLALRLEFRAPDRTLTEADVAALRDRIEARLGAIGGQLRA